MVIANRWRLLAAVALLPVVVHAGCSEQDNTECHVQPTGKISLPADDGRHADEPMEWWSWLGHLQDAQGNWYGFKEAFYVFNAPPMPAMQLLEMTVADLSNKSFHFEPKHELGLPPPQPSTGPAIDLALAPGTAKGDAGEDALTYNVEGIEVSLQLTETKPPVLHHGDGYMAYAFGGHGYHYSRTRMEATGTIKLPDGQVQVSGTAWFNHLYGDGMELFNKGWDWFGIQLDDGRELMLFIAREGADQRTLLGGTLVDAACRVEQLSEVTTSATGSWTSPDSGCTYPMGWTVEAAGMKLTLTPVMEGQELPAPHDTYWEGVATVSGDATGRAFVQLFRYCN
jgi:predicted secreted hydrolase